MAQLKTLRRRNESETQQNVDHTPAKCLDKPKAVMVRKLQMEKKIQQQQKSSLLLLQGCLSSGLVSSDLLTATLHKLQPTMELFCEEDEHSH